MRLGRSLAPIVLTVGALLAPSTGHAVLDINDRGPVLQAGNFSLRVTNAGIIGNAFFNQGLSFDPSFEYPKGSGHEALNHAELWVGAITEEGDARVSGGPMLEWRPTLDPNDRVLTAWTGTPGTKRGFDDDRDGSVDEEVLNGKDDDGDGLIDEDIGIPSDEMMAADYTDDQPQSINYGYPNGESHEPLHLSVHQEAYAWAAAGYDGIAGLHFRVTNTGHETLKQVYLGLYCDLDSRGRVEAAGHMNDHLIERTYSLVIPQPDAYAATCHKSCADRYQGTVPVLADPLRTSGLPAVAVVAMSHTTDPLALLGHQNLPGVDAARAAARAPGYDTTFHYSTFAQDLPPGQGGPPAVDIERYRALSGTYPEAPPRDEPHDWAVLVRCGPFPRLKPGEDLQFDVALVAAPDVGAMTTAMANAVFLHRGYRRNLEPDMPAGSWKAGRSYVNGHETCLEAPEGITFQYYPHCVEKFVEDPACLPPNGIPPSLGDGEAPDTYTHGTCVWTDLDCDLCTGWGGAETLYPWLDPGSVPPPPARHVGPGDREVSVAWDNQPEIMMRAGMAGDSGFAFAGYRLYRLSKWTRETELPPPSQWELIGVFRRDSLDLSTPLSSVTDSSVASDGLEYNQDHYPIGRYRYADHEVLNGFDYLYMVTTLIERQPPPGGNPTPERLESPIVASLDSIVTPRFSARSDAARVWVVPNPYRAHAPWDRPPVPGDPFRRHIDFCGLPRAVATIRIYTVAGDLVAHLDHDGTRGDGQASWDLISRNGQETESGIYLFTVDSPVGHFLGRFVVIR
jgi:hypothetical protein